MTVLPCGHAAHLKCLESQVQRNPQIGVGDEALCPHCTISGPKIDTSNNQPDLSQLSLPPHEETALPYPRPAFQTYQDNQQCAPPQSSPYHFPNTNSGSFGSLQKSLSSSPLMGFLPSVSPGSSLGNWPYPTPLSYLPSALPDYRTLGKAAYQTSNGVGVGLHSQPR